MEIQIQQITKILIFLALVLLQIEAKPITNKVSNKPSPNQKFREHILQEFSLFWNKIAQNDKRKNEISIKSVAGESTNLPELRRIKRNANAPTQRSVILQSLCARVEVSNGAPSNQLWTNGLDHMDLIRSRSEPSLHTIYSPCSDDVQFFDGWGG